MLDRLEHCPPHQTVSLMKHQAQYLGLIVPRIQLDCKFPPAHFLPLLHVGECLNLPKDEMECQVAEDMHRKDPHGFLPAAFSPPFGRGAFSHLMHRPPCWLPCPHEVQTMGNTDPVHLFAAVVEPVPLVSAAQDRWDCLA